MKCRTKYMKKNGQIDFFCLFIKKSLEKFCQFPKKYYLCTRKTEEILIAEWNWGMV